MFYGTSKGRLILWSLFWVVLALVCWTADLLVTRILAVFFVLVALRLLVEVGHKIRRDAYYRRLAAFPLLLERPDQRSNTRKFGPPPGPPPTTYL